MQNIYASLPDLDIAQVSNTIQIWNNGFGVPVDIHKEEGVYIPEMIFGHLLTSSNYDDNEKKVMQEGLPYISSCAKVWCNSTVLKQVRTS
jgi:DNA topoisomerase-2